MKYASNRGFLHPVLGQQEFLWPAKKFQPTVQCHLALSPNKNGGSELRIEANFDLDVEAISNLIRDGQAVCGVWVYSLATSYRQFFRAENKDRPLNVKAKIPTREVRGNIEAHPQIVATTEVILDTKDAHPAFAEEPLVLPPGSPLASHPPTSIPVLDGDRPVRDIFSLEVSPECGSAWDVRPDPDKLTIQIAADEATVDYLRKQRMADGDWAMGTVYLVALADALGAYLLHASTTDAQGSHTSSGGWVETITRRLADQNIQVDHAEQEPTFTHRTHRRSSAWVAQRLLGDPLRQRAEIYDEEEDAQ